MHEARIPRPRIVDTCIDYALCCIQPILDALSRRELMLPTTDRRHRTLLSTTKKQVGYQHRSVDLQRHLPSCTRSTRTPDGHRCWRSHLLQAAPAATNAATPAAGNASVRPSCRWAVLRSLSLHRRFSAVARCSARLDQGTGDEPCSSRRGVLRSIFGLSLGLATTIEVSLFGQHRSGYSEFCPLRNHPTFFESQNMFCKPC